MAAAVPALVLRLLVDSSAFLFSEKLGPEARWGAWWVRGGLSSGRFWEVGLGRGGAARWKARARLLLVPASDSRCERPNPARPDGRMGRRGGAFRGGGAVRRAVAGPDWAAGGGKKERSIQCRFCKREKKGPSGRFCEVGLGRGGAARWKARARLLLVPASDSRCERPNPARPDGRMGRRGGAFRGGGAVRRAVAGPVWAAGCGKKRRSSCLSHLRP